MNYDKILEIASEVSSNKLIPKEGLTLIYELEEVKHNKLDEYLFYKLDGKGGFKPNSVIELSVGDILFKFLIKK